MKFVLSEKFYNVTNQKGALGFLKTKNSFTEIDRFNFFDLDYIKDIYNKSKKYYSDFIQRSF